MKYIILRMIQKSLGLLAKIYLKKNNPLIIGVTGSVGKTSCRMIVAQTLKQLCNNKKIYTSPKNFNSELGIVFSIFEIEKYSPGIFNLLFVSIKIILKTVFHKGNYDILILEYGIDHPGDMDFLLNIVIPDISIFTKLDSIHLENFQNIRGIPKEERMPLGIQSIGDEKFKLMKTTKKMVYLNFKDEYCRNNYYGILREKKLYNNKDFKIINYKMRKGENEIFSTFNFGKLNIKTNILGEENLNYISIGLDIISELKLKSEIGNKLKLSLNYNMQPGRFSIFEGVNNSILIDSSYNAGPESMKKMIENIIKLKEDLFSDYKIGYILGDMRELGQETENTHKQLKIYAKEADLVYTVGKEMKKYLNEKNNFLSSKNAGIKLKDFLNNSENKYILLFKGSQNTIFIEETLKLVIKNKIDINKLVRQDIYWIKKKEKYWSTL